MVPVSPLNTVRNSGPDRTYPAAFAEVGVGVSDHGTCRIPGAIGGLEGNLSLAIAVEVVGQDLRVVRAGTDVAAQVDAPQLGAVQFVGVHVDVARVAGLGVVLGVGRRPRLDDLVLAVAVEVRNGGVVGRVGVRLAVRRDTIGRLVQLDGQIVLGQRLHGFGQLVLALSIADGLDDVAGLCGAGWVHEHGGIAEGLRGDVDAVAQDLEADAVLVQAQHAPAHRDAMFGQDSHRRAVQVFHLPLQRGWVLRGRHDAGKAGLRCLRDLGGGCLRERDARQCDGRGSEGSGGREGDCLPRTATGRAVGTFRGVSQRTSPLMLGGRGSARTFLERFTHAAAPPALNGEWWKLERKRFPPTRFTSASTTRSRV